MLKKGINSVKELALLSGLSTSALYSLFSGRVNPTYETMQRLYDTLNLTSEEGGEIFFGKNVESHAN